MPKQIHKEKQAQKHSEPEESPQPAVDLRDEEQAQITEDMLDEIDSVLEENAEEFVSQYVQKGGQ
jgi:ubiquitin-like protein Pup